MKLSMFDYRLPKELIAQEPVEPRDSSRLMVVEGENIEHKEFSDIINYFERGDVLVLNDTKVEPVKLVGRKITGAKVEVLLSKRVSEREYECRIKTTKLRVGTEFLFNHDLKGKVMGGTEGVFRILFNKDGVDELIQEIGEMPVPPYIKKNATREQYQTVYAKKSGSIAAPTAGFHFTPQLLRDIEKKDVKIVYITLHVGFGTFLPVKADNVREHHMHEEWFEISKATADAINDRHNRLIITGTTALRALESATDDTGLIHAMTGSTDIFIYPGYKFRLKPDLMITNFHLPKSTLIILMAALVGLENIMNAYRIAIEQRYRFYSFGDAMLIVAK